MKFEVYVSKYSYRAEKMQYDKSIYTNQRKFIAFERSVCIGERKITSYLKM